MRDLAFYCTGWSEQCQQGLDASSILFLWPCPKPTTTWLKSTSISSDLRKPINVGVGGSRQKTMHTATEVRNTRQATLQPSTAVLGTRSDPRPFISSPWTTDPPAQQQNLPQIMQNRCLGKHTQVHREGQTQQYISTLTLHEWRQHASMLWEVITLHDWLANFTMSPKIRNDPSVVGIERFPVFTLMELAVIF